MPTGVVLRMRPVRAGIIDVGSNTIRLLVAEQGGCGGLATILSERTHVGLATDIERTGGSPTRSSNTYEW